MSNILQFKKKSLFEVHWRSKSTGFISHGSPVSESSARDTAEYMNNTHTHFFHWVEPVNQS